MSSRIVESLYTKYSLSDLKEDTGIRENTKKRLLDLVDYYEIDDDVLIDMLLNYMSEDGITNIIEEITEYFEDFS